MPVKPAPGTAGWWDGKLRKITVDEAVTLIDRLDAYLRTEIHPDPDRNRGAKFAASAGVSQSEIRRWRTLLDKRHKTEKEFQFVVSVAVLLASHAPPLKPFVDGLSTAWRLRWLYEGVSEADADAFTKYFAMTGKVSEDLVRSFISAESVASLIDEHLDVLRLIDERITNLERAQAVRKGMRTYLESCRPEERPRRIALLAQRSGMTVEEIENGEPWSLAMDEKSVVLEKLRVTEEMLGELVEDLKAEQKQLDFLKNLRGQASGRPWMEALEMQYAALTEIRRLLAGDLARLPANVQGGYALDAQALLRAECYSWGDEPLTACKLAAKTLPMSTRLAHTLPPGHSGWWYFPGPLALKTTGVEDGVVALLWSWGTGKTFDDAYTQERPRLLMSSYILGRTTIHREGREQTFRTVPLPVEAWRWFEGETVTEMLDRSLDEYAKTYASRMSAVETLTKENASLDVDLAQFDPVRIRKELTDLTLFFIAACAWLKQRILTMGSGHVERHRRKQLVREHKLQNPVGDVKVVQLRRVEVQSSGVRDPAGEPVEWSCRWIVNGHWRNQYYAKTGKHEPIYIMPFIKGPEDRPLKVPKTHVYVVNR